MALTEEERLILLILADTKQIVDRTMQELICANSQDYEISREIIWFLGNIV